MAGTRITFQTSLETITEEDLTTGDSDNQVSVSNTEGGLLTPDEIILIPEGPSGSGVLPTPKVTLTPPPEGESSVPGPAPPPYPSTRKPRRVITLQIPRYIGRTSRRPITSLCQQVLIRNHYIGKIRNGRGWFCYDRPILNLLSKRSDQQDEETDDEGEEGEGEGEGVGEGEENEEIIKEDGKDVSSDNSSGNCSTCSSDSSASTGSFESLAPTSEQEKLLEEFCEARRNLKRAMTDEDFKQHDTKPQGDVIPGFYIIRRASGQEDLRVDEGQSSDQESTAESVNDLQEEEGAWGGSSLEAGNNLLAVPVESATTAEPLYQDIPNYQHNRPSTQEGRETGFITFGCDSLSNMTNMFYHVRKGK